jgi:hypothetical protein
MSAKSVDVAREVCYNSQLAAAVTTAAFCSSKQQENPGIERHSGAKPLYEKGYYAKG